MKLKNLTKNESGVYVLKNVVLSYPALFAKKKFPGAEGEGKYSARFLLPVETHQAEIDAIKADMLAIMKEKWKAKIPADKWALRDGELTGKPEDEGHWYLAASEAMQPTLIGRAKEQIRESDDKLYGGAIVAVQFGLWAQDNQYGKRINANLYGVQWLEAGTRFGKPRPTADDGFESFEDGDGFDDDDMPF